MATQSTGLSLGQSALAGSQALRGGGMLRERQIELFADRSGEAGGDLVVSWDGGCANPVCASPLGVAAAFGDLACSVASEVSLEIAPFTRSLAARARRSCRFPKVHRPRGRASAEARRSRSRVLHRGSCPD